MYLPRSIASLSKNLFGPFVKLFLRLGFTPNRISFLSLILSLLSAYFLYDMNIVFALLLLALSLFFDGLDGAMARYLNSASRTGYLIDTFIDRISELALLMSVFLNGSVSLKMVLLAYSAILLVTSLRTKARFDPGFKRWTFFLAPFIGFTAVVALIFFANLFGFVLQLIIIDLREEKKAI
ncbi:hypothetical protein D6764_01410 [Candidatus Woesearchaeota archaeon]|nr:MAG: hypothetical protein D6764_01410 [Candidatus Woesearchaeota archaeon]